MKFGKNGRKKDLETVLVLSLVCVVLYLIFDREFFVFGAMVLLIVGLVFKKITSKISDLWLGFSEIIGKFNTKIILSVIYYCVLTPVAFVYRIFHKDHLNLLKNPSKSSYFISRDKTFIADDFEKMW